MIQHWYELGPFTVFDIETTGMSAVSDRIVELAAVRIDTDGERTAFQTLVHPGRSIPPDATRVHRISDAMVASAPKFSAAARDFMALAAGSTLVAHNARFDLSFMQESLARTGMQLWKSKTMDTLKLIRQTHAGLPSYSLQNLRVSFALDDPFENMQAHRAAADVEWTIQILRIALEELIRRQPENEQ